MQWCFSAEISVISRWFFFFFMIKKYILWIKVFKKKMYNFRNKSIDCTSFSVVTQLVALRHSRKNTCVLLSKIQFECCWRITNPSSTLTKWLLEHFVFRLFRDRFNFISAISGFWHKRQHWLQFELRTKSHLQRG